MMTKNNGTDFESRTTEDLQLLLAGLEDAIRRFDGFKITEIFIEINADTDRIRAELLRRDQLPKQ